MPTQLSILQRINNNNNNNKGKVKVKVLPIPGHEGPEGE
jgi:hypothetical protein